MTTDRRRQLLERDLRAALDVPEAAGPGVVEHLQAELLRLSLLPPLHAQRVEPPLQLP